MLRRVALLSTLLTLAACQTTPETQELVNRNESLQQQLSQANTDINALSAESQRQKDQIDELNRVISVLDTEKSSRVEESTELRRQVRGFVQRQIDALKQFLVQGELIDYIGAELVDRSQAEEEPLLLVDLGNPVPRNGTLTGVAAHMKTATPFAVKVLRPIEDQLVVIWESQLLNVEQAGSLRKQFPVSVGIEKGDFLAYYFPQSTGVTFDEGTGNTRYTDDEVKLGQSIRRSSLDGEDEKRAYSIGVFALLNL